MTAKFSSFVISDMASLEHQFQQLTIRPSLADRLRRAQDKNGKAPNYSQLALRLARVKLTDRPHALNEKFNFILQYWAVACDSGKEIEQSFGKLFDSCLEDASLGKKLALMLTWHNFSNLKICDVLLKDLFFKEVDMRLKNLYNFRINNGAKFMNFVQLIGEFYWRSRCNNQAVQSLTKPLVNLLEILLESRNKSEVILFVNQLYLNGISLFAEQTVQLDQMAGRIRTRFLEESIRCKETKMWLLLATDIVASKFQKLCKFTFDFYQDQLGEEAMKNFLIDPADVNLETFIWATKVIYKSGGQDVVKYHPLKLSSRNTLRKPYPMTITRRRGLL